MEPLDIPIGGGFVSGGSHLVDGHQFAQLAEEVALEIRALIGQDLNRAPVDANNSFENQSSHGRRLLISHRKDLDPFSEVID